MQKKKKGPSIIKASKLAASFPAVTKKKHYLFTRQMKRRENVFFFIV